jgi:hypothetical protein
MYHIGNERAADPWHLGGAPFAARARFRFPSTIADELVPCRKGRLNVDKASGPNRSNPPQGAILNPFIIGASDCSIRSNTAYSRGLKRLTQTIP